MTIEAIRAARSAYSSKNELVLRNTENQGSNVNSTRTDKFERTSERLDRIYEKNQSKQARKSAKKNDPVSIPENPSTVPPVSVEPTTPVSSPTTAAGSYAERYVAIYEKNSGKALTTEERTAKINDVAQFYSDPSRATRLETLVDGLSATA